MTDRELARLADMVAERLERRLRSGARSMPQVARVEGDFTCEKLEPVAMPPSCERGAFIYFLSCGNDAVKIGAAKNIANRLRDLQCGNPQPLSLVAFYWVLDDATEESGLHDKFDGDRIRGEWFRLSPELRDAIVETRWLVFMHHPSKDDSMESRLLAMVDRDWEERLP